VDSLWITSGLGRQLLHDWGIRRQLTVGLALLAGCVIVAWGGTIAEPGAYELPSSSGLRVALALALVGLAVLYREIRRVHRARSSVLLSWGAFLSGLFVVAFPTVLGRFDAELTASELALVGSIAALWAMVAGSRVREGRPPARGVPALSGWVLVAIIASLWVLLATLPLPPWAQAGIDLSTALVWGGGGLLILAIGFRADDDVVSTLGIAAIGVAAGHFLTLGGAQNLAAEVVAVAAVSFALSAAYLELIGVVRAQRSDLEATKERMRDLAHEARTAITAIEGTMYGLDHRQDLEEADRADLQEALQLELQSLRLMLDGGDSQSLEDIRLADVLGPIAASSRDLKVSLHWLVPPEVKVRFVKGALVDILQTLIENARVHGGTDTLGLEVGIGRAGVEISVVDGGPGVDPRIRPHMFERGAKRPGSPGRGLGLDIARKTARLHGGELEHRDNPAGGSVFVLTLPSGGSVLDLSIYESDELVEPVDGHGAGSKASSPDGHRRNPGLTRHPHGHRGVQPGGEVTGV